MIVWLAWSTTSFASRSVAPQMQHSGTTGQRAECLPVERLAYEVMTITPRAATTTRMARTDLVLEVLEGLRQSVRYVKVNVDYRIELAAFATITTDHRGPTFSRIALLAQGVMSRLPMP